MIDESQTRYRLIHYNQVYEREREEGRELVRERENIITWKNLVYSVSTSIHMRNQKILYCPKVCVICELNQLAFSSPSHLRFDSMYFFSA